MAPKGWSLTIIACEIHGVHLAKWKKKKPQSLLNWRRNSGLNFTVRCSGHERDDTSLYMLEIHSDSLWESEGTDSTFHLQVVQREGSSKKFTCIFDAGTPSPE